MEFHILGPLQVLDDVEQVPLGSPKERALLAVLLLHAPAVVSRDRLMAELWGEQLPPTAAKALNVYVSQLRKALLRDGHDPIATRPPGYAIEIEPERLDAARFERLVEAARAASAGHDVESASQLLREALALWRGRALEGLELEDTARNEVARLDELRLGAQMDRIDCDLALALHEHLISELQALVATHPLRERLRGQLMLALYRSGRQAEALQAYRDTRETLVGELGIEPSMALQRLERAILNHDLSLEAPAGVTRVDSEGRGTGPSGRARVRRRYTRRRAAGVAGVLAVLLVSIAFLAHAQNGRAARVGPDALGVLDPRSGSIVTEPVPTARTSAIAAGNDTLWLSRADGTVSRVDLSHRGVIETMPIGGDPGALVEAANAVWVVDPDSGAVVMLDPEARQVVKRIRVGNGPTAIASGSGALWVANTIDGTVTRIDPNRARAVRTIPVGAEPDGIAAGAGSVWVSDAGTDTIVRLDPRTDAAVASIAVGADPGAIVTTANAVWVANTLDGTVSRIDPTRNVVTATVPVGSSPDGLAAAGGAVWVASSSTGSIVRIDARTGHLAQRVELGSPAAALAAVGGRIAVATSAAPSAGRGGTLVLAGSNGNLTLDPATWWSTMGWAILASTNDGLVTFRRTGGATGALIVPDLARSLPLVSDRGTTYTFQLRAGPGYSTGQPVRASDVRFSIERLWKLGSPAVTTVPRLGLVGEQACMRRPQRCDLSRAIVTDDRARTVTFRLQRPDPLFLRLLALPFYAVLPRGLTARTGTPLPATGPYRIAHYVPGRELTLVRNTRFRAWSSAAQPDGFPDRIVWHLDRTPRRARADVLAGRADYLVSPGSNTVGTLLAHHASQLHSHPVPWLRYVFLNTRTAPFDSLDARRALNLAIDRSAIVGLAGGPLQARPTCQVLPPGLAGYRPICPYTLHPDASGSWHAPDLATARTLARRSRTLATPVAVWTKTDSPSLEIGRSLVRQLRALGYRAHLRTQPPSRYYAYVADSRHDVQLGVAAWIADLPAPDDFLRTLLGCSAFSPGSGSSANDNLAHFCNPRIDRLMRRAATLESTDERAADRLWEIVDRRATAAAPLVPLYTIRWVDIVSRRLRDYAFNPVLGFLIDQARVR